MRAKVGNRRRNSLYSWDDEEDFSLFQNLRGMIDSAVQLLEGHDQKVSKGEYVGNRSGSWHVMWGRFVLVLVGLRWSEGSVNESRYESG